MDKNIKELFSYFTEQTKIQIPQNVVMHYLNGNYNSEFVRLFKSEIDSLKRGNNPDLRILISEKFAREILKLIHNYTSEERVTILFQEIYDYHYKGKEIKLDSNTEDFVIEQILYTVTDDYNYKENRFEFPLIQKAYQNLNSNPEEMKVILVLWTDCEGEGGLIVRGKNIGYDIGYSHSDSSEIEFNGKTYEYEGYLFEEYEKLHKPILTNLKQ